jgi:hypothetical protein
MRTSTVERFARPAYGKPCEQIPTFGAPSPGSVGLFFARGVPPQQKVRLT